jgi:excisionase family DNA binding protein
MDDLYPEMLTPEQAARRLGVTPALIRRYCKQGRLGQKIGGRWQIHPKDLERFAQEPRPVGVRRKRE